MRSVEEVRTRIVQHGAPAGGGRRHPQPQEAERRLRHDGTRHAKCGLHNDRLHDIGQDVPKQQAQVTRSKSARRFDKLPLTRGHHLCPDQPGIRHPPRDDQGKDHVADTWPKKRDKGNGQQNARHRKKSVYQIDIQQGIAPATIKARNGADQQAQQQRTEHHRDRDQQRETCAVENARQDVTAKLVSTQKEAMSRRQQPLLQVQGCRVVWRKNRRKEGSQREHRQQKNGCPSHGRPHTLMVLAAQRPLSQGTRTLVRVITNNAQRLRILIFGLNYSPELTGIGKYTGDMAAWLAAQGHQVRVVTAPPYYPAWRVRDDYRGRGYLVEGGGPAGDGAGEPLVFRCPLYVPAQASGLKRLLHLFSFAASGAWRMLREVFAKPDIVLTVEPALFCAPIALMTARLASAPAWLHVQDLEVDAAFDLGLLPAGGLVQKFALAVERALMSGFSRVSSISVRMVDQCRRKGVSPQRAVLFPNWADVESIRPLPDGSSNAFRQELGLEDKVVFLYSGNMGNKQGLELLAPLAAAFRDDPAVHFIFCGDGSYRLALEQEVKGASNVTLLPLQPLERLNDLLNAADVHLLPQRANTADLVMPSRLTGMLASGRPVLACAETGTQVDSVLRGSMEARLQPCGVVVPVGNLPALAESATRLAVDSALRVTLGKAARRYAVEHLGREQVLRRFEMDLDDTVNEARGMQRM